MKKFLAFLLAVVMTAALSLSAFASDPAYSSNTSQSTTIQAVSRVPIIKVALPTISDNPVVLNPYALSFSVKLNGDSSPTTVNTQVASPVFTVTNGTNVPLKVDAVVTTTLGGNLTLATAALGDNAATETKNSAYIALHIAKAANAPTASTQVTSTAPIVLKSGAVTTKNIVTLPAATATYNDAGTDTTVTTPNYLLFQFKGDMAKAPTTSWTAKDTVKVVIAFTFTPDGTASTGS